MKDIMRYVSVVIGSFIIAISFNFIIIPHNLVSFGFNGIASMIYYVNGMHPAINILLLNLMAILIGMLVIDKREINYYLVPAILIPVMIYLTSFLTNYVVVELPEMLLVVIVAGFLNGFGYSLIYKQGFRAGALFLLEEVIGKITLYQSKMYSWVVDVIIIMLSLFIFNYQIALYSLIVIIISKYMITKARFGINGSKVFYIITSKEKEVKNFIMQDLKYELTVLDAKGGFTKKDNKILFTVISSNDYYRLKEGIKVIDEKAFIAITDTYDVVMKKSL